MKYLVSISLMISALFADNITIKETANKNLQITIYNQDLSLIKESRSMTIYQPGIHNVIYKGVAPKMITDSVIAKFSDNVSLYSQNYRYDTISLHKILEKLLDKQISFTDIKDNNKTKTGTLLSLNPIMIKTPQKIHHSIDSKDILIDKIPSDLIVKPSLVWKLYTNEAIRDSQIDLTYLSNGFSWKSDYVVNFNENILDLTAWITIENYSGNSFYDANVFTLAGQVNRAPQRQENMRIYKSMMADNMAMSPTIKEEAFAGYHLYTIPFKVDLLNNEKKQIKFIGASNIKANKVYKSVLHGALNRFGSSKFDFAQYLKFDNSKENKLGLALPKGVIRVYEKDSKGNTHFTGEDRIKHTPKDENITVKLGVEFDIKGERKQTYFVSKKNFTKSSIEYILKNKKDTSVIVSIDEKIPTTKLDIDTTCEDECSYEIIDSNTLRYKINIRANSFVKFESEYERWD